MLPPAQNKQDTFRYATVVFMILSLACFFTAIVFLQDDQEMEGFALMLCGVIMVAVTLWSYYHPFYPILIGTLVYMILVGILIYLFPHLIFHSAGKGSSRANPIGYLIGGFTIILHALYVGYKEWNRKRVE